MGITETIPITASAFFVLLLRAVFPVINYLYAPIPSGVFCIPVIMASVTIGPAAAIDAPIANDFGMVSNPIPSNIPAYPPFFSAIKSAIINTTAPPIKKPLFESFLWL